MKHELWGSTFNDRLEVYGNELDTYPGTALPDEANVHIFLELQPYSTDPHDGFILKSAQSFIAGQRIDWMATLDDPYALQDIAWDDILENDNARKYG